MTNGIRIALADLDDLEVMARLAALRNAVARADAPFLHRLTAEQVQGELRIGHDGEGGEHVVAVSGGRVVGHGELHHSSWDNLDGATLRVTVHPDTRRRGVGTALVTTLEARAAELGRTKLGTDAWAGSPGPGFAAGHGYREALRIALRRQHLIRLDRSATGRRYDEVAAGAPGYEHRGHRLGLLLKLEMLRWLAETEPALETLDTWNAESNRHMVAVNEALGYRVLGSKLLLQK